MDESLRPMCGRNGPQKNPQRNVQCRPVALLEVAQPFLARIALTGALEAGGRRDSSGVPPSPPCAACCMSGRCHCICRKRRQSSRGRIHRSGRGQSCGQRCRVRCIRETLGEHGGLGCGGRPEPQTGLLWSSQARSRSVRQQFGRAACARGGRVVELGLGCCYLDRNRPHRHTWWCKYGLPFDCAVVMCKVQRPDVCDARQKLYKTTVLMENSICSQKMHVKNLSDETIRLMNRPQLIVRVDRIYVP